jgi:hypothetical protein
MSICTDFRLCFSLSLPCTFFFCSAQNRRYLEDDDDEEKQTAREEEEKREKMQQKCCCYQCKQDPYYSLWMRCSSVSRFFRGTRQTRLKLHHLHSLLKQTLGRRRANTRVLIGERERERKKKQYVLYVRISPVMSFVAHKLFSELTPQNSTSYRQKASRTTTTAFGC